MQKDQKNHVSDFSIIEAKTLQEIWDSKLFDAAVDCNIPVGPGDRSHTHDVNRWFSIEGHSFHSENEVRTFHGFYIKDGNIRCWIAEGDKKIKEVFNLNQVFHGQRGVFRHLLKGTGVEEVTLIKSAKVRKQLAWQGRQKKLSQQQWPRPAMVEGKQERK